MKHRTSFVGALVLSSVTWLTADAAGGDRAIMLAQGAPPEICTEVYQPVCGTNQSGTRVTYSNACFARVARATNVTSGECSK